jgi:hypothetical protein
MRNGAHRRVIATVVALVAFILWSIPAGATEVASLGAPSPEASASPAPAGELSEQDGLLAYAECMRDNGVQMDDPRFDANGDFVGGLGKDADANIDSKSDTFIAAQQVCAASLAALKPTVDPVAQAEQTELALRYAACMRELGLDFPDPGADGSKFAGSENKLDFASAEFQAANEVCGAKLGIDAPSTK